jgi:hypothetical protein
MRLGGTVLGEKVVGAFALPLRGHRLPRLLPRRAGGQEDAETARNKHYRSALNAAADDFA